MAPRSAVTSASLLLLGMETPPRDLDTARLKKAYRKMALLTHPDTRLRHGLPDFLHVREAFEELCRYLRHLEAAARPTQRGARRSPAAAAAAGRGPAGRSPTGTGTANWFWKGQIPSRPLRLGEFLFYSGVIPWDVLIKAIVEQKGARPNLGQLACRVGLLRREQLLFALEQRGRGERLGDAFVRLGVLDRSTVQQLLSEQRMLQRPLGWHLVRMGRLPHAEIPAVLGRLWRHNAAVQSATWASTAR